MLKVEKRSFSSQTSNYFWRRLSVEKGLQASIGTQWVKSEIVSMTAVEVANFMTHIFQVILRKIYFK